MGPHTMRSHRVLVAAGGVAALALMCLVIYSGSGRGMRVALVGKELSSATLALQKDIARQHTIGSEVKAWVAASAMKGSASQLKPQHLQQLFEYDNMMASPMFPTDRSQGFVLKRRATTNKLSESPAAVVVSDVKEIATTDTKAIVVNAEHEALLEKTVQEQGEMIKKLEGMMKNFEVAPKGIVAFPATPKKAAARKAAPVVQPTPAVPSLGSWDMAMAAGEGGSNFGTNVVHLYGNLRKVGSGVEVDNQGYGSGNADAESAKGEPNFAGAKEEDTDYWDEDEHAARRPIKAAATSDAAPASVSTAEEEARKEFAAQGEASSSSAEAAAAGAEMAGSEAENNLDTKPPLTSWDMAQFANNVEAGGGTMGTNIAYMYDNLADRGKYKEVESNSPLDNDNYDEQFDEYKAKRGAGRQVLKQRFGKRQEHHVGPHGSKKFIQGRV